MMRGDLLTRVISSESEKSFSFAVKKKRESIGKRETRYSICSEITAFHSRRKQRAVNEKSALGCAWEGDMRKCSFSISFYSAA